MTQVWDDQNRAIPVTVLKVAPVRVVQVKTPETDGYCRPAGDLGLPAHLHPDQARDRALRQGQRRAGPPPGRAAPRRRGRVHAWARSWRPTCWTAGDRVDAIAVSKGKGFAGGMKRHNFKGQGASHGNHKSHRVPGSIGACATPSRVFKGTRMAGRMGGKQVTALNLQVVSADPERQLVLVKGAVPGARGTVVVLRDSVKATTQAGGSPMTVTDTVRPRPGQEGAAGSRHPHRHPPQRGRPGSGPGRPRAHHLRASSPTWPSCTRSSRPSWPPPARAPSPPRPGPRSAVVAPSRSPRRAPAGPARARAARRP